MSKGIKSTYKIQHTYIRSTNCRILTDVTDTPAHTWDCTKIRPNEHNIFHTTRILTLHDDHIGQNMYWDAF
jgi:hypothetical protein